MSPVWCSTTSLSLRLKNKPGQVKDIVKAHTIVRNGRNETGQSTFFALQGVDFGFLRIWDPLEEITVEEMVGFL